MWIRSKPIPAIGDLVEVSKAAKRLGIIVAVDHPQVGILYFKPHAVKGAPEDHIWWIHRAHVKVISRA
jgi:hypothetical protein